MKKPTCRRRGSKRVSKSRNSNQQELLISAFAALLARALEQLLGLPRESPRSAIQHGCRMSEYSGTGTKKGRKHGHACRGEEPNDPVELEGPAMSALTTELEPAPIEIDPPTFATEILPFDDFEALIYLRATELLEQWERADRARAKTKKGPAIS
jgi:hypothetical protein